MPLLAFLPATGRAELPVLLRQGHLEGNFIQSRQIAQLPLPLTSQGSFVFDGADQLDWLVTSPVQSQVLLYADRVVQIDASGEAQTMTRARFPVVGLLGGVFFGVLSGDLASLQEQFTIETLPTAQGWGLTLLPRTDQLKQMFISIQLRGGTYLNQIDLEEITGDKQTITFSDVNSN